MKTKHNIHQETDPLAQMLKQVPLEQPSIDFTAKIMNEIQPYAITERVPLYKKPVFIGIVTVCLGIVFLILHNASFSWIILTEQVSDLINAIREYLPSLQLSNRKPEISPTIVAPIVTIAVIFLVDRIMAARKKGKAHRAYLI